MKRLLLVAALLLLALGCIEPVEQPELVNAKEDFLYYGEAPEVGGYDIINLVYLRPTAQLDPDREYVLTATYLGTPAFTYAEQHFTPSGEISVDLSKTYHYYKDNKTYYLQYWGEIPWIERSAFNIVWWDGDLLLKSISAANRTNAIQCLEAFLNSTGTVHAENLEFALEYKYLPDPPFGWSLYMVSPFNVVGDYVLTSGHYAKSKEVGLEVDIIRGRLASRKIAKDVDWLYDKTGAGLGGIVNYKGYTFGDYGEPYYNRIFYLPSNQTGIVIKMLNTTYQNETQVFDILLDAAIENARSGPG